MKLLAFDTSTAACSVALLDTSKSTTQQIYSLHQIQPQQQGKLILPMIHAVLESASVSMQELNAIAYGCGPGSYTGVRIACSVAQGIGLATDCRVLAISSLAAMAQAAYQAFQWRHLLVALDAHMQEIYWSAYHVSDLGYVELSGQEEVLNPLNVRMPHDKVDWYGIGDGWGKYGEILSNQADERLKSINIELLPTAEAMLGLAKLKYEQGDWIASSEALPVYLR